MDGGTEQRRPRSGSAELGAELAALLRQTGLRQSVFADQVQLSARHVQRLVRGDRLTRPSTLERWASVVASSCPELGPADRLLGHLLDVAGTLIAEESPYRDRVERRRQRRYRKRANRAAHAAKREAEADRPTPRAMVRQVKAAADAGDLTTINRLLDRLERPA